MLNKKEDLIGNPVTEEEMEVFIGLNLVMLIKKSPSYRDYWSSSSGLRDEYIPSFMPLTRFSWILGNLHLNDNNLMPSRTYVRLCSTWHQVVV